MKRTRMGAAAAALLCVGMTGASAEELRFDRVFVLGDSLSDGGTYSQAVQAASGGALPNINYRFLTNAPDGSSRTYAEIIAARLGVPLAPNVYSAVPLAGLPEVQVGGTNYAQGGARVSDPNGVGQTVPGGITTLPIVAQVDRMLADTPSFGANDLVILWGGANDVFTQAGAVGAMAITPEQAAANMAQAATELAAQVARVRAAGAQSVIVVTVPDIGTTPAGLSGTPQAAALLTGLGNTFNAQLTSAIAGRAVIVDSQRLLGAVEADPAKYGFTAPGAAVIPACPGSALNCVQGLNASPDSELRIFADGVHPTTAAQALFGQAAFAGLQAATQTGVIPVAILTALRQQSLSIENRLNPTVLFYTGPNGERLRREVGQIDFFSSVEFGDYGADAQQVTPGLSGKTQVAKIGFDVPVLPNATIGAGLSFDRGQVDFDNGAGGFDSNLVVGAIFGQVALSKAFYLNAALGAGTIDVNDITRSFALGPATETYRGETGGDYRFARIGAGAFLPLGDTVLLNPFAQYTHEVVTIDGYTESAGAASLAFGKTEYKSNRITAGLSAIFSPKSLPEWKFNLRGSIEHDLSDGPLTVFLGPDANTLGGVSAPRPDRTYGYISASVVRDLGPNAFLSLTAGTSVGQSGAHGYTASLAYKRTF
ncbi:autotransporter domain-containing protein [Oceaniglobus roseus]|uniref:autotransporter domain-containing protein n=1 Tax=Oceaniglobus roseus TaxID=1737570 RepID=UPI0012FFE0E2|nr:autotransporter domain-containing protein [Kandeliimicrobium roseum]